jgi:ribosomal protein L37AE/L43A
MKSKSFQMVKVKICPKCGSSYINRRKRPEGQGCRPIGYRCRKCRSDFASPAFKEIKRSTVSIPWFLKKKVEKQVEIETAL